DVYDVRIAPPRFEHDVVTGDRVEWDETQDIVARLDIDPVEIGRRCQLPQPVAEPFGFGIEADDRQTGAQGKQRHTWSVAAERGVAGEGTANHVNGEHRAEAVTDDNC